MGYVLGILGTLTLLAGVLTWAGAGLPDQYLRAQLFWVMTAVFWSGEAIVWAIRRAGRAPGR